MIDPAPPDSVVTWTVEGPAFVVRLANPPANQLGRSVLDGLGAALAAFETSAARILLVGSGLDGFFAAGADIKLMAGAERAALRAYGDSMRAVLNRIAALDRPSIAAIEGRALGGGLELALACTLRVAGAEARFGLPEVKLGLIPGAGGTQRLPRLVGRGHALDIMLTGRQVAADEAYRMGLVSRLVAAGQAGPAALSLAAELGGPSRAAQQAVIRTVDASYDTPLPDGLAYEADQVQALFGGEEAKEGIAAFIEKRPPNFG
jgi:enoyl-CoA hydratase/carnithine racemase